MSIALYLALTIAVEHASGTVQAISQGILVSPDREYVACAMPGEGESTDLVIEPALSHNSRQLKAEFKDLHSRLERGSWRDTLTTKLLYWVRDVQGIVWVSNRPHTLAFGTSKIYNDDPRISL